MVTVQLAMIHPLEQGGQGPPSHLSELARVVVI